MASIGVSGLLFDDPMNSLPWFTVLRSLSCPPPQTLCCIIDSAVGLCDIIASSPGRMTFHRLEATIKLIVLERKAECRACGCAADDKRRAAAPFVLHRPSEG